MLSGSRREAHDITWKVDGCQTTRKQDFNIANPKITITGFTVVNEANIAMTEGNAATNKIYKSALNSSYAAAFATVCQQNPPSRIYTTGKED